MSELQNTQNLAETQDNSSYDEVIYDKLPHRQGNVRFLETIADIYCVNPTDINRCRVLELGAATGKTIIQQAEELPESEFLGIDLSAVQIDAGKEFSRSLNLKNIELKTANIMDIDESWGEFDYIIAHGVYSWVPAFVQDKMLQICATNLSPNGIGMISYNTYPGWHFKECARNLMLLHSKRANVFTNSQMEIQQARAILDYTADIVSKQTESYFSQCLVAMKEHIRSVDDHYLFHEYLETENSPCYFLEFCRRLQEKGLQYIADFDWTNFQTWFKDPRLKDLIESTQSNVISEQYIDFIINRTFRSSVICRSSLTPQLRENLVERYYFFLPNDCTIQLVEGTNGVPGNWKFKLKSGLEVFLQQGKLVDLVRDYLEAHRAEYFTLKQVWDTIITLANQEVLSGQFPQRDSLKSLINWFGWIS